MTGLQATRHPTPIGDVLIVTADDGIVSLHPLHEPFDEAVTRIASQRDAPVARDASTVARRAMTQLDEYFSGRRRSFSLPLEWDGVRGFTRTALEAVCGIPFGETAGYGEVAAMAGSARAARAVGTACSTTPFSIVVPVHRVVRADGSLGEYGGHPEIKAQLLRLEAVAIDQADRDGAG